MRMWLGLAASCLLVVCGARAEWQEVTLEGYFAGKGWHQPGSGPCRLDLSTGEVSETGGETALELSFGGKTVGFRLAGVWFADLGPAELVGIGQDVPAHFAQGTWPDDQPEHMGTDRLYLLCNGPEFRLVKIDGLHVLGWEKDRDWLFRASYRASCRLTLQLWDEPLYAMNEVEQLLASMVPESIDAAAVARLEQVHESIATARSLALGAPSWGAYRQVKGLLAVATARQEALERALVDAHESLILAEARYTSRSWWKRLFFIGGGDLKTLREEVASLEAELTAWPTWQMELADAESELRGALEPTPRQAANR